MPMQKNLYPPDWPEIALALKIAADWTCQRCGIRRGDMQINRHGECVPAQIGVMHLNHDPWNRNARLQVACRICHITYDARDARRKRVMMAIARGQLCLPGLGELYQAPRRTLPRKSARVHKAPRRARKQRAQKEVKA